MILKIPKMPALRRGHRFNKVFGATLLGLALLRMSPDGAYIASELPRNPSFDRKFHNKISLDNIAWHGSQPSILAQQSLNYHNTFIDYFALRMRSEMYPQSVSAVDLLARQALLEKQALKLLDASRATVLSSEYEKLQRHLNTDLETLLSRHRSDGTREFSNFERDCAAAVARYAAVIVQNQSDFVPSFAGSPRTETAR